MIGFILVVVLLDFIMPGSLPKLMLPYAGVILVVWILLFILWFVLGIPLGPGKLPSVWKASYSSKR